MTVGDRIRLRREALGLTQDELAKRIGFKDKSSVAKVEARGDSINTKNVSRFASALATTPAYLMGWVEIGENLEDIEKKYQQYKKIEAEYRQIFVESFSEHQHKVLQECISKLNGDGIIKLLERAEELTEIEKYCK